MTSICLTYSSMQPYILRLNRFSEQSKPYPCQLLSDPYIQAYSTFQTLSNQKTVHEYLKLKQLSPPNVRELFNQRVNSSNLKAFLRFWYTQCLKHFISGSKNLEHCPYSIQRTKFIQFFSKNQLKNGNLKISLVNYARHSPEY